MTERDIFLALLDLQDPTERSAFLTRACAGDTALRERVESLLFSHDNAGSFLGTPALPHLGHTEAHSGRGEKVPPDDGATQDLVGESTADDDRAPVAGNDLAFLAPSTRPDALGRLGHYEVLEVLGNGGFGIVFRAFDETLQRVVAIKVLAPEMAVNSPARKRFLREARSSAKVRHENVVQVYAVEEEPLPYLVMEFVPGQTLQERLDRSGPLEVPEVVRLGRQIAEGLAAAHATGLIHRDVKPANILIEAGPHPHVKITDFGLARAADDASLSLSGVISGTPMYMAPEQASADTLDHRADLFSLGSVLYAMCTGRPPFRAPSTLAVLKRVAEDTPRPIREIIPEVPQGLCDLISRLHAKKPEDRLASAQEVADLLGLGRGPDALQRPGETPAVQTMPPRQTPQAAPEKRPRFRAGRWAAAAAVVLLLGSFGFTEGTGVTDIRGTVIRLFSPEGTLVVEVDDPGVSVKIDGSDLVITGAGAKEIRLKPGRYTVEARKDGKVVSQELVSVTSNGRRVVRVSQEAAPPPPPPIPAKSAGDPTPVAKQGPLPPTYKNSIGMEFVIVPRGKSWLGGQDGNAGDQEVVIPSDFYLGKYEVTQEEWEKVMGANPSVCSRTGRSPELVQRVPDADLRRLPVDSVSWSECQEFVKKLNSLEGATGWIYRLPTELEWEYACRGGPMSDKACSAFNFYLAEPTNKLLPEQANFDRGDGSKGPCKVGSYAPNALGLYDMYGNVWEWCDDKVDGAWATQRGGDWNNPWNRIRTVDRWGHPKDEKWPTQGLRVARVPSAARAPGLDPDRRAAQYVLSIGGTICINGEDRGLRAAAELPPEPFRLTQLDLGFNKQVTDTGLAAFDGCTNVTTISLYGCGQITDAGLAHFKDCKGMAYLQIEHVRVSDDALAVFKNYKNLTFLQLGNTLVTDRGLAYLKDCRNLTAIQLLNQPVTDAGLANLKDCKQLTSLDLRNTRVTDAGLAYFKDCKDLTGLTLEDTAITGAGLALFKDCKKLTGLWLSRTAITGAGMAVLKDCKNLTDVSLSNTSITDEGLAFVKGCDNLTILRLTGTETTNAGLAHIKDSKNLQYLNVQKTKVSAAGIETLKKALPKCKIEWDGGVIEPRAEEAPKGAVGAAFTDADVKRISALPAPEQVDEVRKELMRRNLGFDGTIEHKIEDGVVTEFRITTDKVTDIAPIRVFGALRVLGCRGTYTDKSNGLLADLTPLTGMNLTGLMHLNLTDTKVSDVGMVCFKDCKNLTGLGLERTQVGDAGLVYFKNCNALTHLYLAGTQVGDAGLAHCKDCRKLTKLDLRHTKVGDAGLANCKGMPLTELAIDNSGITDLTPLQGMSLEDISLTPKNITRGLDILRDMKGLRTIAIDYKHIGPAAEFWQRHDKGEFGFAANDADRDRRAARYVLSIGGTVRIDGQDRELRAAAELPQEPFRVAQVGLGFNKQVTDAGLAAFDGCTNVTAIDLYGCGHITDAGLTHFKDCKGMTHLQLEHVRVTDDALAAFKNYKNLTVFNLGNTQVTDIGLAHLKDCKNLTSIQLLNQQVTDAGLAHLKDCKQLTHLDLRGTRVTDAGLAHFKDCKNLTSLTLEGTSITDAGLAGFQDCKDLTGLYLSNTSITDTGLAVLKDCKNLTDLGLSNTSITDKGLAFVKDCNKLTALHLTGTATTDAGLALIKDSKSLQCINLQKTKVSAAGIETLQKAMPKCKIEWDGGVIEPKVTP